MSAFTPINTDMNVPPDAVDPAAQQLAAENDGGNDVVVISSRPADPPTNDPVLARVLAMPTLRAMEVNPRYGQVRDGRPSYDLANAVFTRGTEAEVSCTYCQEGLFAQPGRKKPPHARCIVLAGYLHGSCTNYYYSSPEKGRCSLTGANRAVQRQMNSVQGRQRVSRRDKVKELKEEKVELLERSAENERELLKLEYE
ncbi:MAG: hypothetical protein M1816_002831 [Peltula sp. TS41687]|nr:MAG: hypothetical protein M1816_002831 [Peltula sp. TS41687]